MLRNGEAVLSCIMPVQEAVGTEIRTVEGLANGPEPHALQDAFVTFFATRSEFGPSRSDLPAAVDDEAGALEALGTDIDSFVLALRAADAAGASVRLTGPLGRVTGPVLLVDETALGSYAPVDSSTTMAELVLRLVREHREHAADSAGDLPRYRAGYLRWRVEAVRMAAELRQIETNLTPPHAGWARVAEVRWASALPYLAARSEAGSQPLQFTAGPFASAAVRAGSVLAPMHFTVLERLDALATMPLADFLSARGSARSDDPWFDWTSDGCSGPIPPGAGDVCLRHDFLYRNARMIRDQWALAPEFAVAVKAYADAAFGRELADSYDGWVRAAAPPLQLWIDAAEIAVIVAGQVSEPWNPPPTGEFYGSEDPHN